jgi:TatD DNase family protein
VPQLWATIGLHPHEAASGTDETVALVERSVAVADGVVVAVGECGLDYHYDHSPRAAQRRAFADQVALALRHDLALVIHARDAWDDLFDVLASEGVPERTILHCFTGGPTEATRCLDLGLFVSFSGIVTFKNAADVREAVARCPLDRLLVETDSPFLAPVPHRGRPNEPAYVPLVGAAIAEVKGLTASDVARSSAAAASRAFGLAAP